MKNQKIKSYNTNLRITGILFLLGFAGGLSATLVSPLIESENLVQAFSTNNTSVLVAIFGIFIMGFACTGIAVALYPAIKGKYKSMALGAVVFRGVEGVFHLAIGIIYFIMLTIAKQADTSLEPLMHIALSSIEVVVLVATCAWGIGAILYYIIMLLQKLVPSWLALLGIIGMSLSLFITIYGFIFDVSSNDVLNTALNIPIAIQELILAGYLIIKSFKTKKSEEVQYLKQE